MAVTTYIEAEHPVKKSQWEPLPDGANQAHHHILDFLFVETNIVGAYGLTDLIALQMQVPLRMIRANAKFLDANRDDLSKFLSIHHRDEVIVGLGDLKLQSRFRLLRATADLPLSIELLAGTSLPTGHTEPDPFKLGDDGKQHQHIQFGNGTFDPNLGLEASYSMGTYSLIAWGQASKSLYSNSHGYRGPGLFGGGLGIGSALGLQGWRFLLQPEFQFETPAKWSGKNARNSGRTSAALALGASYKVSPSLRASLVVKSTKTLAVTGGQMDMPFLAMLGLAYQANKAK
jgi:hypothetical protein